MRKYPNLLLGKRKSRAGLFYFPNNSYRVYLLKDNGEHVPVGKASDVSFDGASITGTIETNCTGDYYVYAQMVTSGANESFLAYFVLKKEKILSLRTTSEPISLMGKRLEI